MKPDQQAELARLIGEAERLDYLIALHSAERATTHAAIDRLELPQQPLFLPPRTQRPTYTPRPTFTALPRFTHPSAFRQ